MLARNKMANNTSMNRILFYCNDIQIIVCDSYMTLIGVHEMHGQMHPN